MGFKDLQSFQKAMFPGVGPDRIAERTQGCWNCCHSSYEKAADLWWNKARGALLARAAKLTLESPLGENTPAVKNIRAQVPMLDAKFEMRFFICCSKGLNPYGNPVGDFVERTYLCTRWTATEGASVAREGQKSDSLPEEELEKIHDPTRK